MDQRLLGHGYLGRGSIPRAILFDLTILVALVMLVRRGLGRPRTRGNGPESGVSAEDGEEHELHSQLGEISSTLNPLHHKPLPPFPGRAEDEPK